MPRPIKPRRVCSLPTTVSFTPFLRDKEASTAPPILLTVDEYETLRLIDFLKFTQEDCAQQMSVARTTVQSIYDTARHKLADSLVNGKPLLIDGGNYNICPHAHECCGKNRKNKFFYKNRRYQMKIAVTYDEDQVFQHFGHATKFKIYEVENNSVVASSVVDATGSGHGALAVFLKGLGVNTLICGGIGGGARIALGEAGIDLYPGASGNADACVADLLKGELNYNPNTMCNHHHNGTHQCGENKHGCGGN